MTSDSPNDHHPTNNNSSHVYSRRSLLSVVGVAGLTALAGCTQSLARDSEAATDEDEAHLRAVAGTYLTEGTLYKAPNCNCCLEYTAYLEETTDADIEVIEVDDLAETKEEYGVPKDVESCHTVDIGEYYVEGHVPLKAIGKLAEETPDIAGIALPGMPRGSPGMPGEETEEFVISAVLHDGSYREFMRI